ncbi:MAG: glycosyltransferase [Planctomycetota bacterium]
MTANTTAANTTTSPRMAVIVPSYNRPDQVPHCLNGLIRQTRSADTVVAVVRVDDAPTRAVVDAYADRLPIRSAFATEVGLVHALQRGVEEATEAGADLVVFTDDDAVPRPEWLARLEAHFVADPSLIGVGGRDRVTEQGVTLDGQRRRVGLISSYGRLTGNHHLGVGPPRLVQHLKGVNMAFRLDALREVNFDPRLLGTGAQVCNEVSLCGGIRRRGGKLLYDPSIVIDHYPAPRPASDARQGMSPTQTAEASFNTSLCVLEDLPPTRHGVFHAWSFWVGTGRYPGVAQVVRLMPTLGLGGALRRWVKSRQGRQLAAEVRRRGPDDRPHPGAEHCVAKTWADARSDARNNQVKDVVNDVVMPGSRA